jgi:DNA-binding CsgD family transcriptional regulator/tetratricopeptide (TPR) repeat protein
LVLVGGEAGIGKTTLAREIAGLAADTGALVLSGGCYDLTTPSPYGPWIEIISGYRGGIEASLLSGTLNSGLNVGDLTSQFALLEAFRSFFSDVSTANPLVLILEDLHWSDTSSIELLRFLARALKLQPVLIVATYRSDELQREHVLFQTLPPLVRESDAARLDLHAIGEGDTRKLIVARYGLPPIDEQRLVVFLGQRAEGNPFFLSELLRTLEETGVLVQSSARWSLGDLARVATPPLVQQVIEGRLSRLSGEARDLLALASVIGHDVPLDLWQAVAEASDDALVECIDEALGAALVRETTDGSGVRFTHALIREVLYRGIPLVRRRRWHRLVGNALAARGTSDPDAVAHHFQQAGDPRAATWLIEAGLRAQRAYAWPVAADRYEAALELLRGQSAEPAKLGWLLYRIARMREYVDPPASLAAITEALERGREADDRLLVALALCDLGLFRCFIGSMRQGPGGAARQGIIEMSEGLAAVGALLEVDLERWSHLEQSGVVFDVNDRGGVLALWLAAVGRFSEAVELGQRVLDAQPVAASGPIERVRYADAFAALALASAFLGRPDAAGTHYEQARAANRAHDHPAQVVVGGVEQLFVHALPYLADQPHAYRDLIVQTEEAMTQTSVMISDVDLPDVGLPFQMLHGDWPAVRALATEWWEDKKPLWPMGVAHVLGPLARDQGDPDVAWSIVDESLPHSHAPEPGDSEFSVDCALLRLAITLSLEGRDLGQSRRWLEAHDRWLSWSGSVLGQSEAHLLWGRFHQQAGDVKRAYERGQAALIQATEPRQPLALLAAYRFLGMLDSEASRYDSAEQHLTNALSLADACGAVFERALTLLALAELHAATGKIEEAVALADDVRSTCVSLGATPTLVRADALLTRLAEKVKVVAYPAGLTAREVEVLRLVAKGLSDAEVAERLFLARRTVNTHLTSIFTKLNVNSRTAATRFAIEQGLT